jgi:hypothetical protein
MEKLCGKKRRPSYKVICKVDCDPGDFGGTDCRNGGEFEMTICANVTVKDMLKTIVHEMQHVRDSCSGCRSDQCELQSRGKKDRGNFCFDRLCMEIRALIAEGACDQFANDKDRRACIRDWIERSYRLQLGCAPVDLDIAMQCYKKWGEDLGDFPRRPISIDEPW